MPNYIFKMISQNKIKLINSLNKKKFRDQNRLFIAEGEKLIFELLHSKIKVNEIFMRDDWQPSDNIPSEIACNKVAEQQLKKITQLNTSPPIIALCEIPQNSMEANEWQHGLTLALDDVQDPGNLGTIIRLADWFGIAHIVCSQHTADVYNPKVVQATMGAIARVELHYTNLEAFLAAQSKNNIPIYGTFLDGDNIYTQELSKYGIIVMGNEGKGISPAIAQRINKKLLIPSFSSNATHSESLNVSMATGIVLSEFKRR